MAKAAAVKSQLFVWEGTDKRGVRLKGESRSENLSVVKAELRRQGITPLKVKKKGTSFISNRRPIKPKDIAVFTRQLATMMNAGVPLVQSFDIIARGQENPNLQELLLSIKNDIEGGTSLTEALRKRPLHFDELYCHLVSAGEQSGALETLLDRIATYKEKIESIKAKIRKALFYPSAVLVVAAIVMAVLLLFVIPVFETLFKSFGADLPAFTRAVIDLSAFVQEYWWAIGGVLILAGVAFVQAKRRSDKFNHFLDRMSLKIPVVGDILRKATLARYARTLSTTFAAGVPLVEALTTVAGATGNILYSNAVLRIREDVSTGQSLQLAMRMTGLWPNMDIQMVAIGEESGKLDEMLSKVADFYEEEVDNAVDSLSSLLEPIIIVILGVIIGGMVVAMYLPIFKLAAVV